MKTNYAKLSDEELHLERLNRFRTGPPPEGNGELNREYLARFPNMREKFDVKADAAKAKRDSMQTEA